MSSIAKILSASSWIVTCEDDDGYVTFEDVLKVLYNHFLFLLEEFCGENQLPIKTIRKIKEAQDYVMMSTIDPEFKFCMELFRILLNNTPLKEAHQLIEKLFESIEEKIFDQDHRPKKVINLVNIFDKYQTNVIKNYLKRGRDYDFEDFIGDIIDLESESFWENLDKTQVFLYDDDEDDSMSESDEDDISVFFDPDATQSSSVCGNENTFEVEYPVPCVLFPNYDE